MVVLDIDVVKFRNIKKASLAFSETFNLITGGNAQGKTNLLEAIHLFSLGRSFRTRNQNETIMFGEDYFFLRLSGRSDSGIVFRIEIGMERGGRLRVTVDNKKLRGMSEIIGVIPSVIFTPDDISLSSGPPASRRFYLDYTNAQISPGFLNDVKEYRRILKSRNLLLRRISEGERDTGELSVWDEMLVVKGASIVKGRMDVLAEIHSKAGGLFREILPGGEGLRMDYLCSFNPEKGDPGEALREEVRRVRENEKKRGYTLAGPQYDDIVIYLGHSELRRYGSQGRKRLVAVILKLAQAEVIMERRAEKPVVLLDDIFSELDTGTVSRVRDVLSGGYQSFITSPREENFLVETDGVRCFYAERGEFTIV